MTEKETNQLIKKAAKHYAKFMDCIVPNWNEDPNMIDTPTRVAKSYIHELFSSYWTEPLKITSFDNVDKYDGIVFQGKILVKSMCAHHNLPIFGKAYVAYIPSIDGKIIGLSKLNRIVEYYSRLPQVQENLTMQIHNKVDEVCKNNIGVAVLIKAQHLCCSHRGINHDSEMQTLKLSKGFMENDKARDEFYRLIQYSSK
jgi:GTP cyclohydrolase I